MAYLADKTGIISSRISDVHKELRGRATCANTCGFHQEKSISFRVDNVSIARRRETGTYKVGRHAQKLHESMKVLDETFCSSNNTSPAVAGSAKIASPSAFFYL